MYMTNSKINVDPTETVEVPPATQPTTVAKDQQSAQLVKQAIKDDQALASVAKNINVSAKDGKIILEGTVAKNEQVNLANNTAAAIGSADKIKNRLTVEPTPT